MIAPSVGVVLGDAGSCSDAFDKATVNSAYPSC